MSTAVGADLTVYPLSWSVGPYKIEIQSLSIVSGDTAATVTASKLTTVDVALPLVGPVVLTALPTISGNVVTLAFTDPAASRFGYIILLGK